MKNYLIVISLLLFFQFNFAQDSNSPEYIKAVDYVTCICINDALPDDQKKFDCINEKVDQKYVTDSKTIELFNELQNLKNKSYGGSDYSKFLIDEIFNDEKNLTKIYSFATNPKRKDAKMDKIKADIKEYIRSSKTSNNTESNSSESSTIKSDETDSIVNTGETESYSDGTKKPNLNSENPTSSKFNIWIAILFVLMFIIAILLIRIYIFLNKNVKNLNARIDRRIKKGDSVNMQSSHDKLNSNDNINISRLQNKVNQLEDLIKKISSQPIFKDEKSPEVILTVSKANTPQSLVFYMATPNKEDGSFDINSQTETFKPTQSLYKFTVDNSNSSKAKFEFFSDEAGIRDSIDSPHTYIDPVCEPQNARNPNAKKIVTTSLGTAEKRNDKWVKIINAKIKYE